MFYGNFRDPLDFEQIAASRSLQQLHVTAKRKIMAERIAFLVERLNMSPFHKGFSTMSELDSKSSLDLLDLTCEVVSTIDPDLETIMKDTLEVRVQRLVHFLGIMKYTSNLTSNSWLIFKIPCWQAKKMHCMVSCTGACKSSNTYKSVHTWLNF